MTALLPQRGPYTPGGPVPLRRPRSVYGIPIEDTDGTVRIDYVGKTIRAVAVREAEHRGLGRNPDDEQPWSDLIRGRALVLESDEHLERPWTDVQLAERERVWIRNAERGLPHRPRYNWRDNEDCPGQIPKWIAAEQRAARDRAAGIVSRWTNPELFSVAVRPAIVRPAAHVSMIRTSGQGAWWSRLAATQVGRWAKRQVQYAAAVAGVWAVLWLVAMLGLHHGPRVAAQQATSVLVATAVGVVVWRARKTTNRRRRSRTNRRRTR